MGPAKSHSFPLSKCKKCLTIMQTLLLTQTTQFHSNTLIDAYNLRHSGNGRLYTSQATPWPSLLLFPSIPSCHVQFMKKLSWKVEIPSSSLTGYLTVYPTPFTLTEQCFLSVSCSLFEIDFRIDSYLATIYFTFISSRSHTLECQH